MRKKGIIVTGASGWIGTEVCKFLKGRGYHVVAFSPTVGEGYWDACIRINLEDKSSFDKKIVIKVMEMAEDWSVIHCAGYVHRPVETPDEVSRFYAINYEGTRRVLDWCSDLGIQRLIYISSIALYDWENITSHSPVSENANLVGRTAYADSKLKGEQLVQQSSLDYCIVRLATVFGEGDCANFSKLAKVMKTGRFLLPGSGKIQKSVIPLDLAGSCIARLATMDVLPEKCMNLGSSLAPSLLEISNAFSVHCGFPKARHVPLWLFRIMGRFGDFIAKFVATFPLTTVTVSKLTRSSVIDTSRAQKVFPELAKTSFSEGLERVSDYYKGL